MIVCFIGHRKIVLGDTLKDKVYKAVIAIYKKKHIINLYNL